MIEVQHLTKRYGALTSVDDVSFSCPTGQVTGFLGPNGAGKSTTMRMICGLTRPSAGGSTVDGTAYRDLPEPGRKIGVLLDASAQHAGRTGRETLSLSAQVLGLPAGRVEQMLELVGLAGPAAGRRVGAYSLGMRQRLGIAHALLGDRRSSSSTSPPTGWTRKASPGCAVYWTTSLPAGALCCCPATCCTRSRRSPTSW